MYVFKLLFFYFVFGLIKIGDAVIAILSFPFKFHVSLPKVRLPKISLSKKRNTLSSLYTPIFTRFKYFIFGAVFSALFIFLPILGVIFIQDLPSPQELTLRQIPQTTKIYDRNHVLLYQIYSAQNRTLVPLTDIPTSLQLATIAIEDKDFYKHLGFDVSAIIRSALSNVSEKKLQGGSTITQQLIKSALLTSEQSIGRKTKEIILAFWAERLFTKSQILEMYFNQVAYGGTAWGVEAASQSYFGKNVKDLDLAQSAFLAGLPQAPTTYSPFGSNPEAWKERQKEVLSRMVALKYISQTQASEALREELVFQTPQTPINAPHFVMYIKDLLIKQYGIALVEKGGLTVITSLDLKTHQAVQKIVADEVNQDAYLHLTNGATVVTNPKNGDILAMVGSKDFSDPNGGNVNIATSLRQPGSSIKIVTYAAALSSGMTAATILDDTPTTFPGNPSYTPVNYDGGYHGRIPLRLAFANSYNIPAVKTLAQIGVPTMISYARKLGISSWINDDQYGLSLTLGSAETTMLEMATVYGTFANNGLRVAPNPILKVVDYKGNTLEEKVNNVPGDRAIDEGVAFIVSDILADKNARSLAFGPNSVLNIPDRTVSVKTGTSDNKRDNWTIGYTKDFVVTTWVGNNDNSPMSQQLASGITGAAPIWNKTMTLLLQDKKNEPLKPPANIVQKPCFGKTEYFIKGTEKNARCAFLYVTPTPKP